MILHIFSSFVQEAPYIGTFLAGPSHNHWQERPMCGRPIKGVKNIGGLKRIRSGKENWRKVINLYIRSDG
jgi:hypothetical protein